MTDGGSPRTASLHLLDVWEAHTRSEFETKDVDATMATMVEDAHVDHVPTMAGSSGAAAVRAPHEQRFHPEDAPGYRHEARLSHDRREPDRRRAHLLVHAHARDGLDAAGHRADRPARRDPFRRDHLTAVPKIAVRTSDESVPSVASTSSCRSPLILIVEPSGGHAIRRNP